MHPHGSDSESGDWAEVALAVRRLAAAGRAGATRPVPAAVDRVDRWFRASRNATILFPDSGPLSLACRRVVQEQLNQRPVAARRGAPAELLYLDEPRAQLELLVRLVSALRRGSPVVVLWPRGLLEALRRTRPALETIWRGWAVGEVGLGRPDPGPPPAASAAGATVALPTVRVLRGSPVPAWVHPGASVGWVGQQLLWLAQRSTLPLPSVVALLEPAVPALFGALRQLTQSRACSAEDGELPAQWQPWAKQLRWLSLGPAWGDLRIICGFPPDSLRHVAPAARGWLPLVGFGSETAARESLQDLGTSPVAFSFDDESPDGQTLVDATRPSAALHYRRAGERLRLRGRDTRVELTMRWR